MSGVWDRWSPGDGWSSFGGGGGGYFRFDAATESHNGFGDGARTIAATSGPAAVADEEYSLVVGQRAAAAAAVASSSSSSSSSSAVVTSSTMPVHELPYSLMLATVSDLTSCAGALIRAMLFATDRFVFICQAGDELSVIADETTFAELPVDCVRSSGTLWRAFEIQAGAETIDEPGVAAETTAKLAAASMALVYLSTWPTDIVLVPDARRDDAHAILHTGVVFEQQQQQRPQPTVRVSSGNVPIMQQQSQQDQQQQQPAMALQLALLQGDVSVGFVPAARLKEVSYQLLRLLLATPERRLFGCGIHGSPLAAGAGLTLILDSQSRAVLQGPDLIANARAWRVLQIEGGGDSQVAALVQPVSRALASIGIPVFFLGTAKLDYVLVPTDLATTAIDCLSATFAVF